MAHGLDVVIRAAERVRRMGRDDIRFLIVGDGAFREQLEQHAAQSGVEELVQFTGRLDRSEIPTVIASSDVCLIHLRKTELFKTVIPSKMFEVMAMGKPIIMGVDGLSRDIVMKADAGVALEPDCDEELATIVCRMADDPSETSRKGRHAREYVVRHHNRDDLAKQYIELLGTVASHPVNSASQATGGSEALYSGGSHNSTVNADRALASDANSLI
jgi:glycosyltransferase involved in cell wall biosynthesis